MNEIFSSDDVKSVNAGKAVSLTLQFNPLTPDCYPDPLKPVLVLLMPVSVKDLQDSSGRAATKITTVVTMLETSVDGFGKHHPHHWIELDLGIHDRHDTRYKYYTRMNTRINLTDVRAWAYLPKSELDDVIRELR